MLFWEDKITIELWAQKVNEEEGRAEKQRHDDLGDTIFNTPVKSCPSLGAPSQILERQMESELEWTHCVSLISRHKREVDYQEQNKTNHQTTTHMQKQQKDRKVNLNLDPCTLKICFVTNKSQTRQSVLPTNTWDMRSHSRKEIWWLWGRW